MSEPQAVGMTFEPTLTGVTMVVSTPESGAVFTLNMDPQFALEVCQNLVASLALMCRDSRGV